MQTFIRLILLVLLSISLRGQNTETETRINNGELQMTFPSIYFKHNSAEYAAMPYSVDSCFKYIAKNINDLNSYSIWRDSLEKERLTVIRIQKLRSGINKYVSIKQIHFQSMGRAQKISRHVIEKSRDDKHTQYLLSLNSVLDVSGAIDQKKNTTVKEKKQKKGIPRLVWCGWKYGFHWSDKGKTKAKQ